MTEEEFRELRTGDVVVYAGSATGYLSAGLLYRCIRSAGQHLFRHIMSGQPCGLTNRDCRRPTQEDIDRIREQLVAVMSELQRAVITQSDLQEPVLDLTEAAGESGMVDFTGE